MEISHTGIMSLNTGRDWSDRILLCGGGVWSLRIGKKDETKRSIVNSCRLHDI